MTDPVGKHVPLTRDTVWINCYQLTHTNTNSCCIYRVWNIIGIFILQWRRNLYVTKKKEMRLCLSVCVCVCLTHPLFPVLTPLQPPYFMNWLASLTSPLMGKPVPEDISSQTGGNVYLIPWNIWNSRKRYTASEYVRLAYWQFAEINNL